MYVTCRCQFKGNGKDKAQGVSMNTTAAAVNQSTANTNKQQKQTAAEVHFELRVKGG